MACGLRAVPEAGAPVRATDPARDESASSRSNVPGADVALRGTGQRSHRCLQLPPARVQAGRGLLRPAARHADELAQAWGSVRPKVLERGGRRQSDAFDAAVDALRQAIGSRDAARVQAIANRGVELASEINAVLDG